MTITPRKEEINRQEADWKRENKEAGLSTGDNGLTREQQDELEKARASNTESRKKAEADVYREEAEAMRDYLKEYGTFQQQKLAIAEEYAEKIRKAQSQGERLTWRSSVMRLCTKWTWKPLPRR